MSIEGTGSATDRFGEVIAAGDLNGDGMDDLVIASPGAASNAGEVAIVFGTAGGGVRPQSVADWTLRGGGSQQIGASLVAFDVDGDGADDLLVGVPRAGASDEGEIWVFRGPLSDGSPSTIRGRADADYVILGDFNDEIGSAVAANLADDGVGGTARLIGVGAPEASTRDGIGYVLDGGDLATAADSARVIDLGTSSDYYRRYTGASNEKLGASVVVTPEGVAFGAPDFGSGLEGRAHFMRWNAGTLNADGAAAAKASSTITGDANYERVGLGMYDIGPIVSPAKASYILLVTVKGGGGVHGDLLFWGGGTISYDATKLESIGTGPSPAPHTPYRSGAPVGDWDGDGTADFVFADGGWRLPIGGPGPTNQGAVIFKLGGAIYETSSGTSLIPFNGPRDITNQSAAASNEYLGWSLTSGDFNGDGVVDIAAGFRDDPDVASGAGSVRTYYGPMYPATGDLGTLDTLDAVLSGSADSDFVGLRTEGIGDVNCDGVDDVAVAAPYAETSTPPSVRAGDAYVYFGRTQDDGELQWQGDVEEAWFRSSSRIYGASHGDQVGRVFGLGDLDGDGCDDFMVSGNGVDVGSATDGGSTYLFYGRASFTPAFSVTTADAVFEHSVASSQLGWHVDRTDDLDGDGYPEVAIGAPSDSSGGTDAGAVYLFKAAAAPFSGTYAVRPDADCVIDGGAGDEFGQDVLGFDMDQNGSRDLVVGAPQNGAGSVHVWPTWPCSNGNTTSSTSPITVEGQFSGSGFGFSLAPLGPFEGTGGDVAGLAVGAPYAGASSGNPAPRVSVLPAGLSATTHTTPAGGFDICGTQAVGRFGFALGSGNMVWDDDNSDGRSFDEDLRAELFVGEPLRTYTQIEADSEGHPILVHYPRGAAFAFDGDDMYGLFGTTGCALDATVQADWWWMVDGSQNFGGLGTAIGGAGDLNRDGFDDVIIGEPGHDSASDSDVGRVGVGLSTTGVP